MQCIVHYTNKQWKYSHLKPLSQNQYERILKAKEIRQKDNEKKRRKKEAKKPNSTPLSLSARAQSPPPPKCFCRQLRYAKYRDLWYLGIHVSPHLRAEAWIQAAVTPAACWLEPDSPHLPTPFLMGQPSAPAPGFPPTLVWGTLEVQWGYQARPPVWRHSPPQSAMEALLPGATDPLSHQGWAPIGLPSLRGEGWLWMGVTCREWGDTLNLQYSFLIKLASLSGRCIQIMLMLKGMLELGGWNFRPKGDGGSGPWGPLLPEKLNILVYLTLKGSSALS